MTYKAIISEAIKSMAKAYAPYSDFKVGAALVTEDKKFFSGCNIENAAFSPTCCAERVSFYKAVFKGERSFSRICIVGGKNGILSSFIAPCGVCCQVMIEFCNSDSFEVILASDVDTYKVYKLKELLPVSFNQENL
ncbi:cytidine deaminase [Streptococcus pneumoniae]|nr:cytidine deaminase [Streptococcus pneumoniae]